MRSTESARTPGTKSQPKRPAAYWVRVLERAGYTREGVVGSLPKPDGRRVDKTLFSLLPGE
jgi:hypothetical protein